MLKNKEFFFISVTLKSWSGRKLFDPTATHLCRRSESFTYFLFSSVSVHELFIVLTETHYLAQ